jgi:hypothetical protein
MMPSRESSVDRPDEIPPRISFFRMIPEARLPQRAAFAAPGEAAATLGYLVFPPIDCALVWGGREICWMRDGDRDWRPLPVARFPFLVPDGPAVPPRGFSPPFLGAGAEPGVVHIWSGIVMRTPPGWQTLVGACADPAAGFEVRPGLVETDCWFGPLIATLRLTEIDVPLAFRADQPLFRVRPQPRAALEALALTASDIVASLDKLGTAEWDEFCASAQRPSGMGIRPRAIRPAAAGRQAPRVDSE